MAAPDLTRALDSSTPDPGLFGPGSVSWRVHHDPSQLVGGIRALMLQSLHPQVMVGFHGTTGAREDPWGRLMRTADYVNVVVFGTEAEAVAAAARVRRVHHALGLDRPEWLLWVHCAAVESWLHAYRVSGGPLAAGEADRYVAEQVRAAVLVGCHRPDVPRDVAGLVEYLAEVRPQLEVTPAAREAVRGVLWPPMTTRMQWRTPARPAWTLAASVGFGLLPRWARRKFALPGLPTTDLAAAMSARLLRTALVALPESRRTSPHVAAARTRLGLAAA
ncbi:MAG TPA: oxygenase MpaB family protein [Candidatus Nanopelagicales bacterium]|jgi:uncharacterized protein (DUF2236 family)|nr:oxygenase MpaB family protein [Candidatus Nanopelagicales bacterium]